MQVVQARVGFFLIATLNLEVRRLLRRTPHFYRLHVIAGRIDAASARRHVQTEKPLARTRRLVLLTALLSDPPMTLASPNVCNTRLSFRPRQRLSSGPQEAANSAAGRRLLSLRTNLTEHDLAKPDHGV
jgi:hypothetical protein